jgi:hypothetical protein
MLRFKKYIINETEEYLHLNTALQIIVDLEEGFKMARLTTHMETTERGSMLQE